MNKAAKDKKAAHEEMVEQAKNFYASRGMLGSKAKRTIKVKTSFGIRIYKI